MSSQVLVVMLQCNALWETLGEVDWSDAYWGFPPHQDTSRTYCLCLHTAHYILLFDQISTNC